MPRRNRVYPWYGLQAGSLEAFQCRQEGRGLLPQIAALAVVLTSSGVGAIDIGSRLQLFTDDYLIDALHGVQLRLNHPMPREIAMVFDAPWEGDTCAYVTVFKDGDRYRMYYRGSTESVEAGTMPEVTCMAESADGIVWTRPEARSIRLQRLKGQQHRVGRRRPDCFTPFKDPNPARGRWRAVQGAGRDASRRRSEGEGGALRVDLRRRYPLEADARRADHHRRHVRLAEPRVLGRESAASTSATSAISRTAFASSSAATSKDFRAWTAGEEVTYTGAPSEHLYTNAITPYFREPSLYLGFPKRFVPDRKAVPEHKDVGVSDGVFMSSRDGLHFHLWNEAFIRPGLDRENWTDRNIMTAWGLLELKPGEISLYYSEHYRHPTNRLTRATIRTDGFCSLHAGGERGEVMTKPFVFSGRELVINYATSAVGADQSRDPGRRRQAAQRLWRWRTAR